MQQRLLEQQQQEQQGRQAEELRLQVLKDGGMLWLMGLAQEWEA